MIIRIVKIWCIVMVMCLGSSAFSQDFSSLLKAVNKVEISLAKLVHQEAATRDKQIAELKSAMARLEGTATPLSGVAVEQLADVMTELVALSVEVQEIKRFLNNNSKQLASLDSDSWASEISSNSQMNAISQELTIIRNQLSSLSSSDDIQQHANRPLSGLKISGFFDINGTQRSSAADNTQFDLGQVEIDLDHDISDRTYVRITPVWNNKDGVLSMGPVYTRIQLMDYSGSKITQLSVSTGKMDIPFGIGLYENASVNRKIPTRPMAVSKTHGGWGDYGVQLDLKFNFGNLVVYAVNGFASSAEVDSALSLSLGVPQGIVINTTPSYAFGTRVGMSPFPDFEYGMSFAIGQNQSNKSEMRLIGADLQYSISSLSFKSEYIYHSLNRSIDETNNRSYYFEGRFSSGNWTLASRYGSFKPDSQSWGGRFAIASSYKVTYNVEFKFESLFNEDKSQNSNTFQLIARF